MSVPLRRPIFDDLKIEAPSARGSQPGWLRAEVTFTAVVVLVGVTAGLGGMLLAMLLHIVQHLAYGYDLGSVANPESLLQGVIAASPFHRVVALTLCGTVAGVGWWAVHRFGQSLVSVKAAIGTEKLGPRMPSLPTIAHALLQVVTVALGSPLGREVAPREIGALLATRLSAVAALTERDMRIAIACGAGAGLAAVYNVPLGGAMFVLEVLLNTLAPRVVAAALTACVIASTVAWIGLGDVSQYTVPPLEITPRLVAASIVAGPLFGMAAYAFRLITRTAATRAAHGLKMVPYSIVGFLVIGLIATQFPQILGNGHGPSQLGFEGELTGELAASLLVLKLVAIAISLRVGAAGGVLTPSLTLGALLATVLCQVWSPMFPGVSEAGFAIVGAAAFLAASMDMPMTAILLALEFTRVSQDFCVPIFLSVAGSIGAMRGCATLFPRLAQHVRVQAAGIVPVNPT